MDVLMWVGTGYYPKVRDFIEECRDLGVSKRISRVPQGITINASRVFLAHDEGIPGDAVIFASFIITGVEQIVYDKTDVDEKWITPITEHHARREPPRASGWRTDIGSKYLVGRWGLRVYSKPWDYNAVIVDPAVRFRSFKKIDGDAIEKSKAKKDPPTKRRTAAVSLSQTPESKSLWSYEEVTGLIRLVSEMQSKALAFREFSRSTGRTVQAVSYQYYKYKKEAQKRYGTPDISQFASDMFGVREDD